jgi:membrane-associated protease RseP (regulator of RpoE activity)
MDFSKGLNFFLFLLTILTTTAAGAWQTGINPFKGISYFLKGLPFSATLITILLAHETGHYIISRKHRVNVSLPYFIPAPSFIGTFGAFIKMRSAMSSRRVLLDIGFAGPLTGLLVAIPLLVVGLRSSEIVAVVEPPEGIILGSSLLFNLLVKMTLGNVPDNHQVILHPVAFAGWIGLLITSLNLMPVGQLDGGHISYALLGEKWHRRVCMVTFSILLALGFLGWRGWFIWATLLYILGFRHPISRDFWTPLDRIRKGVGILALVLLFLTFTPVPFSGL